MLAIACPRRLGRRLATAAALVLGLALGAPGATAAAGAHHPHRGLASAHVAWWDWALSIPLSGHPLNPAAMTSCATGQHGRTWFLGGVVNAGGTVRRDCAVPTGTRLVVAVANVECSTIEPAPFGGTDRASLRACAAGVVDPASPLFVAAPFATLDGHQRAVTRAPTPPFRIRVPSPSDNILACAPACDTTTGLAVADGYLLLLHPLRVGRHVLRFGGTFPAFDFTLDITYDLVVRPRGHMTRA